MSLIQVVASVVLAILALMYAYNVKRSPGGATVLVVYAATFLALYPLAVNAGLLMLTFLVAGVSARPYAVVRPQDGLNLGLISMGAMLAHSVWGVTP